MGSQGEVDKSPSRKLHLEVHWLSAEKLDLASEAASCGVSREVLRIMKMEEYVGPMLAKQSLKADQNRCCATH